MVRLRQSMKKRQIIMHSNKMMFLWVAGMSAIVGASMVVSIFLFKQLTFRAKVTSSVSRTEALLKNNNKNARVLLDNIRATSTDAGLNSVKARPDDQALQVVLDALPADRNVLALGSSLQENLLAGLNGVKIESIAVDVPSGVTGSPSLNTSAEGGLTAIPLSFTISSSDPSNLKDALTRIERSIRMIDIDTLSLEAGAGVYTMSVTAHAYYYPAQTVEMGTSVCKPNGGKC